MHGHMYSLGRVQGSKGACVSAVCLPYTPPYTKAGIHTACQGQRKQRCSRISPPCALINQQLLLP